MSLPTSSPRPSGQARLWGAFLGLTLCLPATRPAVAQTLPLDPAQRFRSALSEDRAIPSTTLNKEEEELRKAVLAYRKASLTAKAKELRSLRDIARVLPLQDWKLDDKDRELADLDFAVFKGLTTDFKAEFQAQVARNVPANLSALATLIGELAAQVTVPAPSTQGAQVRQFLGEEIGPELGKLTTHPDADVKVSAAKALGKLYQAIAAGGQNPARSTALIRALAAMLDSKEEAIRLGAVEALGNMVPGYNVTEQKRSFFDGYSNDELRTTLDLLLAPLFKGLADSNATIRRISAETTRRLSEVLAERSLIRLNEQDIKDRYPARGRTNLTPEEKKRLADDLAAFKDQLEKFDKTLKIFNDKSKVLEAAAKDSDPVVRRQTLMILEDLAVARRRNELLLAQIMRVDELPPEKTDGEEQEQQDVPRSGESGQTLKKLLPTLIESLESPDLQARLKALDTLEMMGRAAKPAGPALVKRLEDRNVFVRWAAARALGRLGTPPTGAVEALAKLLSEDDLSPRLAACVALERYGPAASAAVPALTRAVARGDGESRTQVMQTLLAIGKAAEPAVPAITLNLTDGDSRVRRAAAYTLGRFGKAAASAAEALRKATGDEDAEVRRNAAEALLNVPAR